MEIGVRNQTRYGRNLGWSIESTRSLLASENVPTKNQRTSQLGNTATIEPACARCVRATIQPVAVWVSRIIVKLPIDSAENIGILGSPMCKNFIQRKSQRSFTAQPVAMARKA